VGAGIGPYVGIASARMSAYNMNDQRTRR
jgi:hypothetical protein